MPCCRTTCSCVRERTHQTSEVSSLSVPSPGLSSAGLLVDREGSVCPSPPDDEDGRVVTVGGFCVGKRQGKWAQLLSDSVPTGFSVPFVRAGQSGPQATASPSRNWSCIVNGSGPKPSMNSDQRLHWQRVGGLQGFTGGVGRLRSPHGGLPLVGLSPRVPDLTGRWLRLQLMMKRWERGQLGSPGNPAWALHLGRAPRPSHLL